MGALLACCPGPLLCTASAAAHAGDAPATVATVATIATIARIVSMVPAVTETLFALGLGDRVVGVSASCDYPPQVRSLPKVGTFVDPVAEAIVALTPDLVLTSPTPGNQPAVQAMQRAGIRVEVVRSEGGIAEAKQAMQAVADAARASEQGRALVASLEVQLAGIAEQTRSMARPRVAVVVGREPLVLAGPQSYLDELVAMGGGINIAGALSGRWPRVGYEFLVEAGPEVIVDLTVAMAGQGNAAPAAWMGFESIPAVANGRVYPGPSDAAMASGLATALLRPGPRLGDAGEVLARWIHPELPPVAGQGAVSRTAP